MGENIHLSDSTPGEIRSWVSALEIGQGIGWSPAGVCDKMDGIIYSVRISNVIRTKDEIWTNYMKVGHFDERRIDY